MSELKKCNCIPLSIVKEAELLVKNVRGKEEISDVDYVMGMQFFIEESQILDTTTGPVKNIWSLWKGKMSNEEVIEWKEEFLNNLLPQLYKSQCLSKEET